MKYFSVKFPTKINGIRYTNAVCYSLTAGIADAVEKLAREGKAVIYDERVFFQNGKIIENKKDNDKLEIIDSTDSRDKEIVSEVVKKKKKG